MFKGDGVVPEEALAPFEHDGKGAVGCLVLVPAEKYPHEAVTIPDAANFLGWVGMIICYEDKRSKVKVKIHGDRGYEHLTIKSAAKYSLDKLTRLA